MVVHLARFFISKNYFFFPTQNLLLIWEISFIKTAMTCFGCKLGVFHLINGIKIQKYIFLCFREWNWRLLLSRDASTGLQRVEKQWFYRFRPIKAEMIKLRKQLHPELSQTDVFSLVFARLLLRFFRTMSMMKIWKSRVRVLPNNLSGHKLNRVRSIMKLLKRLQINAGVLQNIRYETANRISQYWQSYAFFVIF